MPWRTSQVKESSKRMRVQDHGEGYRTKATKPICNLQDFTPKSPLERLMFRCVLVRENRKDGQ